MQYRVFTLTDSQARSILVTIFRCPLQTFNIKMNQLNLTIHSIMIGRHLQHAAHVHMHLLCYWICISI